MSHWIEIVRQNVNRKSIEMTLHFYSKKKFSFITICQLFLFYASTKDIKEVEKYPISKLLIELKAFSIAT